jgi:hypothetical protein
LKDSEPTVRFTVAYGKIKHLIHDTISVRTIVFRSTVSFWRMSFRGPVHQLSMECEEQQPQRISGKNIVHPRDLFSNSGGWVAVPFRSRIRFIIALTAVAPESAHEVLPLITSRVPTQVYLYSCYLHLFFHSCGCLIPSRLGEAGY